MLPLPVSIIVVSRDRSQFLKRCLKALSQLDHPLFEIVVVACAEGAEVARVADLRCGRKVIPFERANISEARNEGIAHAAGDIIALIDDDAVPEPTWLSHLSEVFADKAVAQAGGTTLRRNGISIQHAALLVDPAGRSIAAPTTGAEPQVVRGHGDFRPRLCGTNMAFRRDVLLRHNGFDPRFAFYLEETDLTLRISKGGGKTLHVPKAIVHHATGPSRFRAPDRTPRRLYEIGASSALFHAKHTAPDERDHARAALMGERRGWLLKHMQRGTLTPDDVHRLMRDLQRGYANPIPPPRLPHFAPPPETPIVPVQPMTGEDIYLTVDSGRRRPSLCKARDLVRQGHRVTVFDFSPNARYHRVTFNDEGFWHHIGGIFGREVRTEPLFQLAGRQDRINRTLRRLAGIRSKTALIGRS
ncbi:glycosyltransferase [Marivita sp. GX14005]|uniref:glycosyltransferase family 2 protein n=1 Tax=Marivita sp. GX14005 TaxID=2942276 RepID=UPI00201849AB|nr:glycosyltransferase [Marivita sp. GX14005]MCL3881432.1 glycosyltransferase [Marivita sp. GX14005]